jgi:hypothetical protein
MVVPPIAYAEIRFRTSTFGGAGKAYEAACQKFERLRTVKRVEQRPDGSRVEVPPASVVRGLSGNLLAGDMTLSPYRALLDHGWAIRYPMAHFYSNFVSYDSPGDQ